MSRHCQPYVIAKECPMNARLWFLIFAGIAVTGVAAGDEPSAAIPADASVPTTTSPCTLVMGGGGIVTANRDVNGRWFAINRAVASNVIASLKGKGYALREFIVDIQDANQRFAAMARELDQDKCGQVLQITNNLIADPTKGGTTQSFAFDAFVIHLSIYTSTDGHRKATVVGEYQKNYTYPLTKEVMDNLSLSELGGKIAADVDEAKVLKSGQP
jgi:hypothetical protein